MKILIIGAGMYTTGRKEQGAGTILASLAETSKNYAIDQVTVIAKSPKNQQVVSAAVRRINKTIGSSLTVRYRPVDIDSSQYPKFLSSNKFDCAVVAVPDHLHGKAALPLLNTKIPCLVVKPLAHNLSDAKKMLQVQKRRNVYAAVEFHKRYDETNLCIKKILQAKRLGDIAYFTVDYSQKIHIPLTVFRSWAKKTNIFQYLGVHYVDLIYFLTGFNPKQVLAVGTKNLLKRKGLDVFDSIHAIIKWENPQKPRESFLSFFNTNWIDPRSTSALSDQKYKIIGTNGRIECDQKNRGLELVHETEGIQHINPYFSDFLPDPDGNLEFSGYGHKSISRFILDVLQIKQGLTTPKELEDIRPTFKQSLVSMKVVEAANQSLRKKSAWISIP